MDFDAVARFGGIDANVDPLLDEAFEDHEAYIQARSHERFLIIGRKGSGKTAIYRRIVRINDPNVFAIGHMFSDYPWHHHAKQKQLGVPEEHCFIHSWEYLINITLARVLLTKDRSQPWSEESVSHLASLEAFILDTYGSREPDMNRIFLPETRIKLKGELQLNFKIISGKLVAESIPMLELPTVVQEINSTLSNTILACANPENHYFVCFDELDLGFSLEKGDYESRLIGLLWAARNINGKARKTGKNVSVIVFIRDDIYGGLHFEDKNKLTQEFASEIRWDVRKGGPSLKKLMEKRFHATLGVPEAGAWEKVFDETKRMTGKQTKYDHILDRTFHRPRDIIKFCNEILLSHRENRDDSLDQLTGFSQFSNKDIIDAREAYSRYLLAELDDEITKHVPRYKLYLEILKTIGSLQFTMDDFDDAFEKRKTIIEPEVKPIEILAKLFDFSVIGFYRPGGVSAGSDYVWKHKDRKALFDERANSFRIHYGFMEVLGVKKFTRSSE